MELARSIDVFLHLDKHLGGIVAQYGVWVDANLFAIVFSETGLVVMPFLPGDSLRFVCGAIAAIGGPSLALPGRHMGNLPRVEEHFPWVALALIVVPGLAAVFEVLRHTVFERRHVAG